MYELIQAGPKTWYIDCPAKIGVYQTAPDTVWLIDSGNDKEAGRKILKILAANQWTLAGIINTHSNADHIGGNHFIQQRTQCAILSTTAENALTQHPYLEAAFLYGGYPCKALHNKFLRAEASLPTGDLSALPPGLSPIALPGHYFDMTGIKTDDGVYFLADCLGGIPTLDKYHLFYIYDVKAFLETLDMLETLRDGALYIPAHAPATTDLQPLIAANRAKVLEICDLLLQICQESLIFEDILQKVFQHYQLKMDFNQYVLVGSTVRSYLSYLSDQGRLGYAFVDSRLLWQRID